MNATEVVTEAFQLPEIILVPKIMLTYKEAAQSTGLSVATLENLVSRGKLPVVKVGASARFRVEDLRKFAEENLVLKNQ